MNTDSLYFIPQGHLTVRRGETELTLSWFPANGWTYIYMYANGQSTVRIDYQSRGKARKSFMLDVLRDTGEKASIYRSLDLTGDERYLLEDVATKLEELPELTEGFDQNYGRCVTENGRMSVLWVITPEGALMIISANSKHCPIENPKLPRPTREWIIQVLADTGTKRDLIQLGLGLQHDQLQLLSELAEKVRNM